MAFAHAREFFSLVYLRVKIASGLSYLRVIANSPERAGKSFAFRVPVIIPLDYPCAEREAVGSVISQRNKLRIA